MKQYNLFKASIHHTPFASHADSIPPEQIEAIKSIEGIKVVHASSELLRVEAPNMAVLEDVLKDRLGEAASLEFSISLVRPDKKPEKKTRGHKGDAEPTR